tara:strand:+ start:62 stop:382 length:321 start_codon:yes stop_codon:yes gene_type:complete
MNNKKTQTQKAFTSTLIVIGLLAFAIIGILVTKDTEMASSGLLVGLPIFISGIVSIVGLIQTIKAFKDPKTTKLFISLIVNSMVIILFITAIIANILDIANSFAPQ